MSDVGNPKYRFSLDAAYLELRKQTKSCTVSSFYLGYKGFGIFGQITSDCSTSIFHISYSRDYLNSLVRRYHPFKLYLTRKSRIDFPILTNWMSPLSF